MDEKKKSTKQSKGGEARKEMLSPERRSEIAKKAAESRWAGEPVEATHDGPLRVGDVVLDCAVLNDGTRVISQTKFMNAMGIYYSGWLSKARSEDKATADLPLHLPFKVLKPFIESHFGSLQQLEEVQFRTKSGTIAKGIRAEALPKICEVWLDARNAGVLKGSRQVLIAQKAEILIRGFAHVGVIALIDEATGYQYERQRNALEELLKEFLADELRRWVKTFPAAYFRELCRLRKVQYRPDMKLPQYFGHLTNDIIYKRLHPHVLESLKQKTPKDEKGRPKTKLHQWLSDDVGNPKLLQHLGAVVGLMKISKTYEEFKIHLDVVAPIDQGENLFLQIEN